MINVIKWQKYIGRLKKDNRLYQINYFTIHYGPSLSKGKLQLVLTKKLFTIIPTEKTELVLYWQAGRQPFPMEHEQNIAWLAITRARKKWPWEKTK